MKPTTNKLLRRRKWFRTIFGIFSLSGIMFAFQACYGTPQDFGMDVEINGKVLSGNTDNGIRGILINIKDLPNATVTDENGNFSLFAERQSEYLVSFLDRDGDANGSFSPKDTLIAVTEYQNSVHVTIRLN